MGRGKDRQGGRAIGDCRIVFLALVALALLVWAPSSHAAQTISSTGTLTQIHLSGDLECQVEPGPTFIGTPPAGACGTYVSIGGASTIGPDGYPAVDATPYTEVSQTPVSGSGSPIDPYRVTTVVDAGTQLRLTQTDSYVVGQPAYRTEVALKNLTASELSVVLYRAGDCYFPAIEPGPDLAHGFYDSGAGGIYCAKNPNNSPPARIAGFAPLSPESHYYLAGAALVAPAINESNLPNDCDCDTFQDNAAALSWLVPLPAHANRTRAFMTVDSAAGTPPDLAPPNTTIDSGPTGTTTDSTPSFTFSASEAGTSFQCQIDLGGYSACSSPHTTAQLLDGAHTFEVRAADAAGNADPSPASRSFTIDATAPARPTFSDTDPDSPANDNSPEIKGAAEAGSTVKLYTNATCTSAVAAQGSGASFASPGLTVAVADNSSTTFYATATDAAGNTSPCSTSSITYVEDSTVPNTAIDSGPSGTTNDSTPTFGFSSEAGASFECRVYQGAPSGSFSSCTSPHTTQALTDGAYTFEVRARDSAGNVDATPAQRGFTVTTGTSAPPTLSDTDPDSPANDNSPEVKGSATAGSTVKLYTNATCTSAVAGQGSAASFASPGLTVSVADNSSTTLYATATDATGNTSPCSTSSITYVEDSAAPAPPTLSDTDPDSPANDNSPEVKGSAAAGSTVKLYTNPSCLEPAAATGTAGSFASPGLTVSVDDNSTTAFYARAISATGNIGACSLTSITYVEDSNPPETTIVSGPAASTSDTTPTFSFSSSEPSSTFQCRLDGGSFFACSSPYTTPALTPGSHTFEVRAVDPAGNVDSSPATPTDSTAALRSFSVTAGTVPRLPPSGGTRTPPATSTGPTPRRSALDKPTLGKTVNIEPVSGDVFVSEPPATARSSLTVPGIKGRNFVLLATARTIPVGSLLDTRKGTVRLTSARDTRGATQAGRFKAGVFQVLQSRKASSKGLTELRLKGASFRSCGRRGRRARVHAARRRTIRRLRANARGRFRTSGRYSAATIRGTAWITTDRCDGTLTTVRRGRVAVRDRRRKRTVILTAGMRYLARAPR